MTEPIVREAHIFCNSSHGLKSESYLFPLDGLVVNLLTDLRITLPNEFR